MQQSCKIQNYNEGMNDLVGAAVRACLLKNASVTFV